MVSEERQPSLHRMWISRSSPDPPRNTPFEEPQWRDTLVPEYRKTRVESPSEEQLREPPAEVFSLTVDSVLSIGMS
jgi:hypothetical protein